MKTTMKLFAAITIMLGFSINVSVQAQSDDATIAAKATVVGAISVDKVRDLEFGNLSVSGPKTISLAGVGSGGVTGGTEQQGIYSITKGANTSVDLQFITIPDKLDNTDPLLTTPKLPIGYLASWNANATDGTVSAVAVDTDPANFTTVPQNTAAPIIYVHLGGTVTPGTGTDATVPGSYTGNITLRATFN
jgi:hypothetical protein